ncbi:hypothetical protein PTTG_02797 [Puccinia triticina 1-1 BBBD Race 1]|uniref:Uncharacterized protein n=1 Tax=Puccinia triticina (isolate 1-1 / race 1 (BBBD)) TaxID=630390 RepID=A0A180GJK2_PUCT1|nr:hypothetical protein PTTG_02797 [Puccinia triticina 1-1 BBBD Race 1]WAR52372.1 hypothetical protein PtB15_1B813 [Puccinia triticina]
MFAHGIRFLTVIGLLARHSLAIDCYPGTTVRREECENAISQIVYRDGVLGKASKSFGYVNGDCSIIVQNPKGADPAPTKKQIERAFAQILDKCQPGTGGSKLPSNETVLLNIGNRGLKQFNIYDSDFPFLKETCGLNSNAPETKKEDCVKAYESISISIEGEFLDDNKLMSPKITKTFKSCTVSISTSDESDVIANRQVVRPTFDKLLDRCNGKSGVVSLKEGAAGDNGRVILKTRSSVLCGNNDPQKQVCH